MIFQKKWQLKFVLAVFQRNAMRFQRKFYETDFKLRFASTPCSSEAYKNDPHDKGPCSLLNYINALINMDAKRWLQTAVAIAKRIDPLEYAVDFLFY